jgi:hypothetical protein
MIQHSVMKTDLGLAVECPNLSNFFSLEKIEKKYLEKSV